MDWNVFVVAKHPGEVCYLAALPHDVVFRAGLPWQAVVGEALMGAKDVMADRPEGLQYERFKANPEFARFLHWVLAKHAPRCPSIVLEAGRQRNGYVYIVDMRTPTPAGPVPPSDIIGAVEVQNGEVTSYQGSPQYEPFGRSGLMQLEHWLEARFKEELSALATRRSR
jgi:hypothetical protein